MLSKAAICEGAFVGQALASNLDPTVYLALNIHRSLMEKKKFDGPDILSRHLLHYATVKSEVGAVIKFFFQKASAKEAQCTNGFLMNEETIRRISEQVHYELNEKTAGCNPAQRAFPLALCPYIATDELFDVTKREAALTHFSPIAGDVAGVVNLIVRSLLEKADWNDAVADAFRTHGLHPDVQAVERRFNRWSSLNQEFDSNYAPEALVAALHYCSKHTKPMSAINEAMKKEKIYCVSLVGILAGARWGITLEEYQSFTHKSHLAEIRTIANQLSQLWTQDDHPKA